MQKPPDAKAIGEFLKDAREAQGVYSQEQAAPLVGTTTRTMGGWERGETVPPSDKFFAMVFLYDAVDKVKYLMARRFTPGAGGASDRARKAAQG